MDELGHHLRAITARTYEQRVLRAAAAADRSEPAAREWVRRWRPQPASVALPECSCAQGRCATCN